MLKHTRSEEVGGETEGGHGGSSEGRGSHVVQGAIVDGHDDSVVSLETSELRVSGIVLPDEVHNVLADGEGVSENSPSDTFPARRGGERAIVGVELGQVEAFHEALEGDSLLSLTPPVFFAFDRSLGALRNLIEVHGIEESLSNLELGFTIVDGLSSLVTAFSFSEHDTEHGVVGLVVGITILSSLCFSELCGSCSSLGMG